MHENWKRQAVGLSVTCCYYNKTDEVISLIKGKVCFDRISVQTCLALFLWACCHRTSGQEECVREDLFTSWGKKDTDRHGPGSPKVLSRTQLWGPNFLSPLEDSASSHQHFWWDSLSSTQSSLGHSFEILTHCGSSLSEERTKSFNNYNMGRDRQEFLGEFSRPIREKSPRQGRREQTLEPILHTHCAVRMTTLTGIHLSRTTVVDLRRLSKVLVSRCP